jgi:hypothetical protein
MAIESGMMIRSHSVSDTSSYTISDYSTHKFTDMDSHIETDMDAHIETADIETKCTTNLETYRSSLFYYNIDSKP